MPNEAESDTTSVLEEYVRTITVNHRQYQQHAVEHSICFTPVDEDEAYRLTLQDSILKAVFDNKLIFPPVPSPKRVLDCGYGSAAWAVAVAEQYPECEVYGVDISPHLKPADTPPNLWLQLDDLNRSFTFPSNRFDVVQSRLVAGGINKNRWPSYVRDMMRVTKPGGWVQMVEIYFNCQSDNNTLAVNHALRQWSARYLASIEDIKDPRVPMRMRDLMISAGLTEVDQTMIPLPLCGWSTTSRRDWDIGQMNRENASRLLTSLALYPCTQRSGVGLNELLVLIAQARNEATYPGFKAYFPLYVCIGRKPRR